MGFHADNGSEYINHTVSKLLDKLRVEFTKSRPRHSNDNGLAETKNGAIVRKSFGYAHIPQRLATTVNTFCQGFLNPYINFHDDPPAWLFLATWGYNTPRTRARARATGGIELLSLSEFVETLSLWGTGA